MAKRTQRKGGTESKELEMILNWVKTETKTENHSPKIRNELEAAKMLIQNAITEMKKKANK